MQFTDKQKEFWNGCSHRWNIKTGATRSGKTFLDFYLIPKRIRACTGKGLIVLLGNTKGTLERNILTPMREIWSPSLVGNISSDNTVRLFGRKCYALGADKVNQVSKIQGSEIQYCYGDEITTWHEDIFIMLKSRLSASNSCFDGTCNPDAPGHWLKKFIDGKDENGEKTNVDVYNQSYTIYDNTHLDSGFVRNLENEYRGTVYFDRFILGLWKAAEGIIYRQFADNPSAFIIDSPPKNISFASVGVDFGGNGSAHAFVLNGFTPNMREAITLDEFYLKKQISPAELEAEFIEFVRRSKEKYPVFEAYCDSAETTLIQGLKAASAKAGLAIEVKNAIKGEINNRIRFFSILMSQGRYKVMRHCTSLIGALASAVWDSKSITVDKRLDDGKMNIDSLDALEYSTEKYMKTIVDTGGMKLA